MLKWEIKQLHENAKKGIYGPLDNTAMPDISKKVSFDMEDVNIYHADFYDEF